MKCLFSLSVSGVYRKTFYCAELLNVQWCRVLYIAVKGNTYNVQCSIFFFTVQCTLQYNVVQYNVQCSKVQGSAVESICGVKVVWTLNIE